MGAWASQEWHGNSRNQSKCPGKQRKHLRDRSKHLRDGMATSGQCGHPQEQSGSLGSPGNSLGSPGRAVGIPGAEQAPRGLAPERAPWGHRRDGTGTPGMVRVPQGELGNLGEWRHSLRKRSRLTWERGWLGRTQSGESGKQPRHPGKRRASSSGTERARQGQRGQPGKRSGDPGKYRGHPGERSEDEAGTPGKG